MTYLLQKNIKKKINLSVSLGLIQFVSEYAFILSLQSFFIQIGGSGTFDSVPTFFRNSPFTSILIFGILKSLLVSARTFLSIFIFEDIRAKLRTMMIQAVDWRKSNLFFHDFLTLLNERANSFGLFYQSKSLMILDLVCLVTLCFYSLYISWELSAISVASILIIFPIKFLSKKMVVYSDIYNHTIRYINKYVFDTVSNISLLSIYNLERKYFERGIKEIENYKNAVNRFYLLFSLKSTYPLLVGFLFVVIIGYLGSVHLHKSADVIISFIYVFMRISQLASTCFMNRSEMGKNQFSVDEINNFFIQNSVRKNDSFDITSTSVSALDMNHLHLSLNNITYQINDKKLFSHLSFELSKGEVLNIKGKSGSGKSTLVRMILGMANPDSGEIRFNSIPVANISAEISNIVGYVGPENYFSKEDTLFDNLIYGNQKPELVSEEEVVKVLESLDLSAFSSKEKLYEPVLSPPQYSTGQAQRLGIARALLRKPKILILDEATANLDLKTEKFVIDFLEKIKKDIIIILITHKESLNSISDKIIDLDQLN